MLIYVLNQVPYLYRSGSPAGCPAFETSEKTATPYDLFPSGILKGGQQGSACGLLQPDALQVQMAQAQLLNEGQICSHWINDTSTSA